MWFSLATAETFITPRPRLPWIRRRPPSSEMADLLLLEPQNPKVFAGTHSTLDYHHWLMWALW